MPLRLAMVALWAGGTSVPSPAGTVAPVFPSLFRDNEPPHWLTSFFWCSFLVWTCQWVVLHHLKCSYQIIHLRRDLPKLLHKCIPAEVISIWVRISKLCRIAGNKSLWQAVVLSLDQTSLGNVWKEECNILLIMGRTQDSKYILDIP